MPITLHTLPLSAPTLPSLANWLLEMPADASPEALADVLVLLPSQRACTQLQHALVDGSPNGALLLPWITTPARLADELAELLGLAPADVDDDVAVFGERERAPRPDDQRRSSLLDDGRALVQPTGFEEPTVEHRNPGAPGDPLYAVWARRTP